MKFFFNLAGAVHDPDNEGIELPNIGTARLEAVRFAAEYLRDRPEVVWLGDELRLEVTDENRMILFTLVVFGVDAPAIRRPASGRAYASPASPDVP
jgi:hypothetical protein